MFYLVLKNTVVSGVKAKAGDVVEINDTNRSEERRVGKEGRNQGALEH